MHFVCELLVEIIVFGLDVGSEPVATDVTSK